MLDGLHKLGNSMRVVKKIPVTNKCRVKGGKPLRGVCIPTLSKGSVPKGRERGGVNLNC